MTITRSEGTPLPGIPGLVAGGGYRGCSEELDALVVTSAGLLAEAYGSEIEIRFSTGSESGSAWLKTADGYSAHVGIWAELTTARKRAVWERFAEKSERMAETGLSDVDGHDMGEDSKPIFAEDAAGWRAALANWPEGTLSVGAHITSRAAGPLAAELARLPGWNPRHGPSTSGGGYHHGRALSAYEALARCLRFAPPGPASA